MKLSLAFILGCCSVIGLPLSASAGGGTPVGGSTSSVDFTSNHTGTASATCLLAVTDGVLPIHQGFVSSLTSTTLGKISTVCNTTTSTITVKLIQGTAPVQAGYTERFRLTNGTGVYSVNPSNGYKGSNYTYIKNDLSNNFSGIPSTMNVGVQGLAASSKLLAAGTYIIRVQATVTP